MNSFTIVSKIHHTSLNGLRRQFQLLKIILTGIDNDINSTVDACPNACEMWKAIERLKQDGESLESYYSRFYKMMNELVRNQCDVTNHQVNIQFLLQLQPEWQRFVTLVKQSQELKTVSYHKLYDILKQHQNEVNEIRAERLARTANPLALVAQQQPAYHPQNHPNHYTQNSSTRSQQTTRNRGKAIVNSSAPIYDQEPATVTEDDEMSKEKEIDKLMALISLSFKKIYKPTNNNLRTSSNTSRANQDNSPRINRGTGYENQRVVNVVGARENVGTQVVQKSGIQCYNCKEYGHVSKECQKPKRAKDAAYHKEKMLLCKQEEAGVQLNAEQADWKDDTDDESDDQELEAHYMYMAQIQEVTPDIADISGPIFDAEPLQKVPNDDDNYNVFDDDREYPEQPKSVKEPYPDMCYDREQDDTDGLAQERDLPASLIEKLKCEIDDSKNRNKFLESSNQALVDKLKGEIEDFKTKNKSLESSNNHFKEANNELSKTNQLMFKDLKKFQAELDRYHDVNYASKVAIDCAKAKGDLMSYKIESEKFPIYDNLALMLAMYHDERFKHAINLELDLQQCKGKIKNDKSFKENQSNVFLKEREQYFEIQDLKAQLQDNGIAIRVIPTTSVSGPQLKSNRIGDRVMPNNGQGKKQEVEDHHRNFKFSDNKTSVTACNDSLNAKTLNVNFVCVTCGKCVLNENHDMCILHYINGVNSWTRQRIDVSISTREPKQIMNQSVSTSHKKTVATDSTIKKPRNKIRKIHEQVSKSCSWWYPKFTPPGYKWKLKSQKGNVNPNVSMPLGNASRTANILEPMIPRCFTMSNTPLSLNSFTARTVKFGNDQIAPILGYGDLIQGTITSKQVYYFEGLNHNLFSIGQFCDADLEVAFQKSTCYIRDLKGNDLLTGSRGTDLYSITLQDTSTPNPICLMAKATSSQAWLWHRCLSHLNFDTINLLSKNNIVTGLPKLKYVKDHL
ncbi:retrovirus-related pol polyprotein from transposon TNT 1-94 [Tanacetum coccineum]